MIPLGVRHRASAIGSAIRGVYVRWAVYGLLFSLIVPNIDMGAHVGGLAAGFGIAYLAGTPRYQDSPAEQIWRIAAWFGLIITAISFFKMYMAFSHYA